MTSKLKHSKHFIGLYEILLKKCMDLPFAVVRVINLRHISQYVLFQKLKYLNADKIKVMNKIALSLQGYFDTAFYSIEKYFLELDLY